LVLARSQSSRAPPPSCAAARTSVLVIISQTRSCLAGVLRLKAKIRGLDTIHQACSIYFRCRVRCVAHSRNAVEQITQQPLPGLRYAQQPNGRRVTHSKVHAVLVFRHAAVPHHHRPGISPSTWPRPWWVGVVPWVVLRVVAVALILHRPQRVQLSHDCAPPRLRVSARPPEVERAIGRGSEPSAVAVHSILILWHPRPHPSLVTILNSLRSLQDLFRGTCSRQTTV
jgi:hypothetical protein